MIEKVYNSVWEKKLGTPKKFQSGRCKIAANLLPHLKGDRMIDIGCGSGEAGLYFSNRFREVHGMDISSVAIRVAKQRGLLACQIDLNTQPLFYSDRFFDLVLCLDVIEHIFDPYHLLCEIRRVLKPKGIFVLSYPNIGFLSYRLHLLTGTFPATSGDTFPYDGGHLHYWTLSDMRRLLKQYGFSIFKIGVTGRCISIKSLWPNLLARNPFLCTEKV